MISSDHKYYYKVGNVINTFTLSEKNGITIRYWMTRPMYVNTKGYKLSFTMNREEENDFCRIPLIKHAVRDGGCGVLWSFW